MKSSKKLRNIIWLIIRKIWIKFGKNVYWKKENPPHIRNKGSIMRQKRKKFLGIELLIREYLIFPGRLSNEEIIKRMIAGLSLSPKEYEVIKENGETILSLK